MNIKIVNFTNNEMYIKLTHYALVYTKGVLSETRFFYEMPISFVNFLICCFLITEPFSFSLIKNDSPKKSFIILDAKRVYLHCC